MHYNTNAEEFNKHMISSDLHSPSNHVPLFISIIIRKEYIQDKKQTIIKNSKEEKEFINELRNRVENIDTTNILDCKILKRITQGIHIYYREAIV